MLQFLGHYRVVKALTLPHDEALYVDENKFDLIGN